jgi:hypothetical protein
MLEWVSCANQIARRQQVPDPVKRPILPESQPIRRIPWLLMRKQVRGSVQENAKQYANRNGINFVRFANDTEDSAIRHAFQVMPPIRHTVRWVGKWIAVKIAVAGPAVGRFQIRTTSAKSLCDLNVHRPDGWRPGIVRAVPGGKTAIRQLFNANWQRRRAHLMGKALSANETRSMRRIRVAISARRQEIFGQCRSNWVRGR